MNTFKINNHDIIANGPLARAIKEYRERKIPMSNLVSHYAFNYLPKSDRQKAANPFEIYDYIAAEKELTGRNIEHGRTVQETAYEYAAWDINASKISPTTLISAAFYVGRNDAKIECDILLSILISKIKVEKSTSIAIINPSPSMIEFLDKSTPKNCKIDLSIEDELICRLYSHQFRENKQLNFILQGELLSDKTHYDYMIVTPRDNMNVKETLGLATAANESLMLVPETFIKYPAMELSIIISNNNELQLKGVTQLPSCLAESSPIRKVLLKFVLNGNDKKNITTIANISYDKTSCVAHLDSGRKEISTDSFWHQKQTIYKRLKDDTTREIKQYEPKLYDYSNEITLNYTLKMKGTAYVAKVFYRRKIRGGERRKIGKTISSIIEIRAKTLDLLQSKIEKTPYDKRFNNIIVEDILDYYNHNLTEVSLKTVWFCVRSAINNEQNQDEIAKKLFEFDDLRNILSDDYQRTQYLMCLIRKVCETMDLTERQCGKFLDSVFSAAKKRKYIKENPLEGLSQSLSTDRRYEYVRDALTKKNFETYEENTLIKTSLEMFDKGKRNEALLYLIRDFTGITTREACALTWDDYITEPGRTPAIMVNSFLSDNGIVSYIEVNRPQKIRKLPLVPLVVKYLELHKSVCLNNRFVDTYNFGKHPILADTKKANKDKTNFLDIKSATKMLKKVLSCVDMPAFLITLPSTKTDEAEYLTDLNKFRGDIITRNYIFHATHDAKYSEGELTYSLGTIANDTFSNHYCDYSTPLSMRMMHDKLMRWDSLHDYSYMNELKEKRCLIINGESYAVNSHIDAFEVELELQSDNDDPIELFVDSDNGAEIKIVVLEEE